MSKAYRIRIAGVQLNLHLDRSIGLQVDLLPILGRERMLELFLEQLRQAGARELPDGRWQIASKLSDWIFDPKTLQVEVRPRDSDSRHHLP